MNVIAIGCYEEENITSEIVVFFEQNLFVSESIVMGTPNTGPLTYQIRDRKPCNRT